MNWTELLKAEIEAACKVVGTPPRHGRGPDAGLEAVHRPQLDDRGAASRTSWRRAGAPSAPSSLRTGARRLRQARAEGCRPRRRCPPSPAWRRPGNRSSGTGSSRWRCSARPARRTWRTRPFPPVGPQAHAPGQELLEMVAHLNSHKHQLFYYLKLQGKPVGTADLWA